MLLTLKEILCMLLMYVTIVTQLSPALRKNALATQTCIPALSEELVCVSKSVISHHHAHICTEILQELRKN